MLLDLKLLGPDDEKLAKEAKEQLSKLSKSTVMTLFPKSAELKAPAVADYLLEQIQTGTKLLCFSHHQSMMNYLQSKLKQHKIAHIRIDGATTPKDRHEACQVFQDSDKCRVALLSITACATGLNLTAANLAIFAEAYWNPGILAQVT